LTAAPWAIRPYRTLVVVEHWSDPASVLVNHEKDDFQPVVALLKAWSVPFDIFRLDQQRLDDSYLFDRERRIRYGAVIWLADSPSYEDQSLSFLQNAVERGTSLVVAHSRFLDPALEQLLGLKFKSPYTATDPLKTTQPHFITRELGRQKLDPLDASWDFSVRPWVENKGAQVLIAQSSHPVLTVNSPVPGASAIWMGVPNLNELRDSPYWRGLFFRAMIWSLGYLVVPNMDYSHTIEVEIDDWGTSDKGYLSYWRYLEPNEEMLRERLIAPLQKRHAVVSANVITGYMDRQTKRIVSPWSQEFTDLYGLHQDFSSTQKGLKAAVAAGVLEIQSHGWTHMLPDLYSPPGPWWTADLAGEASVDGWYKEFGDERRGLEVPAVVQLFHLQRSIEYLKEDFGQRPLELRPGGGAWSKSYANHTARVAAQAGFGLFHAEPSCYYYLDRNLALDMTGISPHATLSYDHPIHAEQWPAHPDGPFMAVFHDRDISLQLDFIERMFGALPSGYQMVSANQYIAYEHARIDSLASDGWTVNFNYDEFYCPYFAQHASSWRVWVSDTLREQLQSAEHLVVAIDGKAQPEINATDFVRDSLEVDVPAGLGHHVWRVSPGTADKSHD
jgi:peptidoglycan/xylan/chitin deacetylase (PgdA/CDA1 family)